MTMQNNRTSTFTRMLHISSNLIMGLRFVLTMANTNNKMQLYRKITVKVKDGVIQSKSTVFWPKFSHILSSFFLI